MPPKYEILYIFAKLMFFLLRPTRVFLRKDIASRGWFQVLLCLGFLFYFVLFGFF